MPVFDSHVQWQRLSRERFDHIVETLLIRYHEALGGGSRAEALDGRGGDGGRDVDAHVGDRLTTIYQLKFFPEGFSGGHSKSRKPQIRKSFEEAMKDRPPTWVLVVPRNPTPDERRWVRELRKRRQVRIEIWGDSRLDAELAKFPDLARWAVRDDEFITAIKQAGQEKAALLGPDDLSERLRDLRELASSRSEYWDVAIASEPDGTVVQRLVAKRSDAASKEPIAIDLTVNREALEPAERAKFERLNDYGVGEATIGGTAVHSFQVRGPEWIAGERSVERLELRSLFRGSVPVSLLVLDEGPIPIASEAGRIVSAGPGAAGSGTQIETGGGLTLTFLMPHDGSNGTADLQFEPAGLDASEVGRSLTFINSLSGSKRLQVRQDGATRLEVSTALTSEREDHAFTDQLIDDLSFIAAEMHTPLRIPESISPKDRMEIRRLRLILDGYCVLEPAFGSLNVTLSGQSSAAFEEQLAAPFAMALVTDGVVYAFQGQTFRVPGLCIYSPNVEVLDASDVLAALRAGEAAGREVAIRSPTGSPFQVYVPERMVERNRPRVAVMLDVPGHDEPALPPAGADAGAQVSQD